VSPASRVPLRLPLLGEEPGEIPPIDDALRMPFSVPTIALVATHKPGLDAARAALHAAARARGLACAELEAIVRDGRVEQSTAGPVVRVSAPLLELPEQLAVIDAQLAVDLLVAIGPAIIAIRAPRVSVLVTSGLPTSEWDASVRSVRSRFDLVVPELDAHLARELVARI
jgi:hypothetical protein